MGEKTNGSGATGPRLPSAVGMPGSAPLLTELVPGGKKSGKAEKGSGAVPPDGAKDAGV